MVQRPARSIAPLAGLVCGLLAGGAITTTSAGQARPNLVLTSPTAGQVVKGTIRLAASADAAGLTAIQFHVNGLPYGSRITSGACGVDWDTAARADATYVLSAVGSTASGPAVVSPAVTVRVENLEAALLPEAAEVGEESALIRWRTPLPATSRVEFGTSVAYGDSTAAPPGLRVDHEVRLAGLSPRTTYHYRVHSRTSSGADLASADAVLITGAPPEDRRRITALPAGPSSVADAARRKAADRARAIGEAHARGLRYLPGEVVIQFRPGTTTLAQQRALMGVRSRPSAETLQWRGDLAVLHDQTQPDARILAEQLNAQPEVLFAEPNYLLRVVPLPPVEPRAAASRGPSGGGPLIAIVDTGVTPIPDAFTLVTSRDFSGEWTQADASSRDGHGTRLAALVAAALGGAEIVPVKVCMSAWEMPRAVSDAGVCPADAVAAGIRYAADRGAAIIVLALGGPAPSRAVRQAIVHAAGRGAFVVIEDSGGGPGESYPAADAASIDGAMSVGPSVLPGGAAQLAAWAARAVNRGITDPAKLEATLAELLKKRL